MSTNVSHEISLTGREPDKQRSRKEKDSPSRGYHKGKGSEVETSLVWLNCKKSISVTHIASGQSGDRQAGVETQNSAFLVDSVLIYFVFHLAWFWGPGSCVSSAYHVPLQNVLEITSLFLSASAPVNICPLESQFWRKSGPLLQPQFRFWWLQSRCFQGPGYDSLIWAGLKSPLLDHSCFVLCPDLWWTWPVKA